MLKIPDIPPVKTRLPLAAWAIAAIVTFFSLMSSLLHGPLLHDVASGAEQAIMQGMT